MGYVVSRTLADRVAIISEQYRIPKATAEACIRSYIEGLQEDLINGRTAKIDGIASVNAYDTGDDYIVRGRMSRVLKARLKKHKEKMKDTESTEEAE